MQVTLLAACGFWSSMGKKWRRFWKSSVLRCEWKFESTYFDFVEISSLKEEFLRTAAF